MYEEKSFRSHILRQIIRRIRSFSIYDKSDRDYRKNVRDTELLLVNFGVFERLRFGEIWAEKPANLIEQCQGDDFVMRESPIGYTPPPARCLDQKSKRYFSLHDIRGLSKDTSMDSILYTFLHFIRRVRV